MADISAREGPVRDYNEDMFFSERVPIDRMPSADLASSFSVETIPHTNPVGHHRAYDYTDITYAVGLVTTTPGYATEPLDTEVDE